ncbi:rod shape-determining protein MreC [Ruminiclostridium sufflavum DSM 19573]|uniref:Cell shape-determining protein MreC n=1 Tax=Ruminiclostridium sufflavum DSM 19573 TaxID=1121337 RepID=A0A318XLL1_9FIRM|nr:rod shape-determining protein MreC [Ruminiclostridium sufflavum]PYG87288.1 rod shape-determining protein MreC [Ruminiclostridium sufflavum DSM 19573]
MKLFTGKSLIILIISLVLIVCIGLSVNSGSSVNWIGNIISVPFSSVGKVLSYAGQQIEEGVALFDDVERLRAENKRLNETIDKFNNERTEYLRLKSENDDLKNVLKMRKDFEDFEFIGANVIAKDSGSFFNIFLADKGFTSGINNNMPVITSKGLVGKVTSSQPFSSKIISIIEDGSAASAIVAKTGDLVVVKGDSRFSKDGLCKIEYIPADLDLSQGDVIETSGMGGIYPKGIIIGTVKEVRQGESDLDKYAIIEPAVDLRRLTQVVILRDKASEESGKEDVTAEMELADK